MRRVTNATDRMQYDAGAETDLVSVSKLCCAVLCCVAAHAMQRNAKRRVKQNQIQPRVCLYCNDDVSLGTHGISNHPPRVSLLSFLSSCSLVSPRHQQVKLSCATQGIKS
jgi:hypothetical protein